MCPLRRPLRQKQSGEELEKPEETQASGLEGQLFHDAFEASPIGIALEDLEGWPIFVNPALCSMLGFSGEEMRSKHCVESSTPEDAKKNWALFQQLRAGSIDHYQLEKRFFRRDGSLFWGRLSVRLVNRLASPLVLAMVEDLTERRTAQQELLRAQEEERQRVDRERRLLETLELVTKETAAAVACCSRDFRHVWANQGYADWLHRPLEEIVGRTILDVVGKKAFETLRHHFERVLAGEKVSYEEEANFRGIGQRWISASYTPTLDADAVANGWLIVLVDVTERKLAEEALSTVSQKLIQAHEEERTWIARELHDDVNQRIALLAAHLDGLKQGLPAKLEQHLGVVRKQVEDLGSDIQALSHSLHSPKLELLGLAAAAASFCRELSVRQMVEIDFHSENVPKELPGEVSLCLFRVLQEALQNSTKHSGSRHFQVSLRGAANEIELTVHDSGIGFDPEEAIKGRGLGLTSMQERVKLVDGQLSIDSKPQRGTTIQARVFLRPRMKSASAVG
jgi:PAS domain S-box-containing protein